MKKERKDNSFIKKPVYPGGMKAMREFISKNLKYPKEAQELGKEGIVRVKYSIDYKGKVFDSIVLSSLGYGCDEEAERLVRLLKFDVEKTRKVKVVFHKTLQIRFQLPKVKVKKTVKAEPPKITSVQYNYVTTKSSVPKIEENEKKTIYHFKLNIK